MKRNKAEMRDQLQVPEKLIATCASLISRLPKKGGKSGSENGLGSSETKGWGCKKNRHKETLIPEVGDDI